MEKIKVFVIDRQPLFRQGIRSGLSKVAGIDVIGEQGVVEEEVLPVMEASTPDVVLVDVDYPSLNGLKLCRKIKKLLASTAVIVLTPQIDDEQFFEAIKSQASAYLSKEASADEIAKVIKRCASGEHPINGGLTERPEVAKRILQQFQELSREKEIAEFTSPLTQREMEILGYMAKGYLNKQIANELDVSEQTVKNHITSILRKLNVNARTQAVVVAIKKGLVSVSRE
jgi:DNA-binding NarL/FixJ family response regulator